MTVCSDIDSRDSDSVSNYLEDNIKRKTNLMKKKIKKIRAKKRKNTKRKRANLSRRTKKDLRKLKRDQFQMTSTRRLTIMITDRIRRKLYM